MSRPAMSRPAWTALSDNELVVLLQQAGVDPDEAAYLVGTRRDPDGQRLIIEALRNHPPK